MNLLLNGNLKITQVVVKPKQTSCCLYEPLPENHQRQSPVKCHHQFCVDPKPDVSRQTVCRLSQCQLKNPVTRPATCRKIVPRPKSEKCSNPNPAKVRVPRNAMATRKGTQVTRQACAVGSPIRAPLPCEAGSTSFSSQKASKVHT